MATRTSKPPKPAHLKSDVETPLVSRPIPHRDPRQPRLPFDEMPERIEPCLALLSSKIPSGDNWLYEVKLDGYRLAVHVEPTGIRILTRGGLDWTHRFPSIAQAATRQLSSGHY
jgi:bifunctional non-homologous end joining protein LigD